MGAVSKMKPKIITIEGASSSSLRIEDFVYTIVKKLTGNIPTQLFSTMRKEEIFRLINAIIQIYPSNSPILFVAKSLGAIRLCQYIKEHISDLQEIEWRAVLIDPHSPFPSFYGRFRKFKLGRDLETCIVNYYQRNKYPRGAIIKEAKNIEIKTEDHFSIVKNITVRSTIASFANDLQEVQ
jgi:hypothetical protein